MKYNIRVYCLKLSKMHQSNKTLYLHFLARAPRETAALFKILTRSVFNMTSMKYYG